MQARLAARFFVAGVRWNQRGDSEFSFGARERTAMRANPRLINLYDRPLHPRPMPNPRPRLRDGQAADTDWCSVALVCFFITALALGFFWLYGSMAHPGFYVPTTVAQTDGGTTAQRRRRRRPTCLRLLWRSPIPTFPRSIARRLRQPAADGTPRSGECRRVEVEKEIGRPAGETVAARSGASLCRRAGGSSPLLRRSSIASTAFGGF